MPRGRALALVLLRLVVGWHFVYEGYYKLLVPGWSRTGAPLAAWSASGYLKSATGPFAGFFHSLGSMHGTLFAFGGVDVTMSGVVDVLVPLGLFCAGVSLMLGLFTQIGAWVAFLFLTLFYIAYIPTGGVPVPNAEGTYLIVNKTLVELAAVGVLIAFRTGELAGLDLLRTRQRPH
jgi:thiosulfate dehydrogenase [quinone] large subunit